MSVEQGEVVVESSAVLTEEEVTTITETPEEEAPVALPSDEVEFEMPEKFKGKTAEEIAKIYLELEKFKGRPVEEETPKEEAPTEDKKEEPSEELKEAKYKEYIDYYTKNGGLTDEQYTELAEAGYTKEQVQEEIDYYEYKKAKSLRDILAPLEGGEEKFKEVAMWAKENKTPEEVEEFNKALKASSKVGQQAMLKGLYAEYDSNSTQEDVVLHTNKAPSVGNKGYANESEFFKDIDKAEYKTDRKYAEQVANKLAKSDTTGWSF